MMQIETKAAIAEKPVEQKSTKQKTDIAKPQAVKEVTFEAEKETPTAASTSQKEKVDLQQVFTKSND